MNQNHNIKDICTEVNRALDSPMVDIIRSGSVELLGLINPAIGTVAAIGNNILSKLNTFKLSLLLNGLESGLDIEKRLNELYIYVSSSPENAITVANLLQKTIYSECPKVCVVYGLVLANHLTPPSKLTHEEMIVCKALENATDHDLKNFKEIMKSYMERKSNGNRVVFPPGLNEISSYTTTCDWCVYNRIFVLKMAAEEDIISKGLDLGNYYYEAKPATILLDYIDSASQVWDYS